MIKILQSKNLLFLESDIEFQNTVIPIFKMFVKEIFIAQNFQEANDIYSSKIIDFIVSDTELKGENSFEFLKQTRSSNSEIPIAIISFNQTNESLLKAMTLNLSAYLPKPINYADLIEVLTTVAKNFFDKETKKIPLKNGFEYDKNRKIILKDNEIFTLNKKEILFIEFIIQNRQNLISKDALHYVVWEDEDSSDSSVRNFILRIRKRFGKDFIHSVKDAGYSFF